MAKRQDTKESAPLRVHPPKKNLASCRATGRAVHATGDVRIIELRDPRVSWVEEFNRKAKNCHAELVE